MFITYNSGIYTLKSEQILPISIEDAWKFFSTPQNLERITPDELSFNITKENLDPVFEGQIITYKIGLFPMIRSNWVTEITNAKENDYFIDEQRFGPYKFWHHLHKFVDLDGQVLMYDEVNFKLPFGFIGRLFYPLVVKPKLERIFNYRKEVLEELFQRNDLAKSA